MTAQINENTQYTDPDTGELLNNGFVYIGSNGLDAKLNPITIYADRELTTALLNPQRTGPDGRVVNKIWVAGQYSMKVEDSDNVQKLNELSMGSDFITGNSTLISVSGTNLLVATASSPASSLVDNQVYILTAVNTNTLAMTLTIDAHPTYPIKKHHDVDMEAGDVEATQTLAVVFNDTDKVYELFTNSAVVPLDILRTQTAAGVKTFSDGIVSDVTGDVTGNVAGNLTGDLASSTTAIGTLRVTKGADIASANDMVLLQDGNDNDITGVITVNGMTDGIANEVRQFHADGIFILKHNTAASAGFSSLYIVQGEADITTAAGDEWKGRYDGTVWRIFDYNRADGTAVVETIQNAASDGSSLVLISSQTASADPEIDFTSGLDSTYDRYAIYLSNVIPVTDAVAFHLRVSDDGGSTFKAGASDYRDNVSNVGSVTLASDVDSATATGGLCGWVYMDNPASSSYYFRASGELHHWTNTGAEGVERLSGIYATASAIDAIRLFFGAGNIASGTFHLYGLKKS